MKPRRHPQQATVAVEEQVANPLLRPGLRLPHHRSTTRHLASLYPCQIDPGLGPTGVLMGTDLGSGSTFHYDAFDLYARGIITSPNMVILGLVGRCKSTVVKTLLYRSLGLLASPNGQPRFAEIADPKRQIRTTRRRLGMTRLKLVPGGTTRLGNPSDPRRPRETPQQPHPTHDRPRRYAQPSSRSPPPDGSNNSSPSPNPPTYPADTK